MIKIHDLKPAPGSTKAKRRVGRGIAGKGGKTAGSGIKGQTTRNTVNRGFEGGQTPLARRTPKSKGFNNPFRVEYHVVNLSTLDAFDAGAEVTPETLRERGLVAKRGLVKVLARVPHLVQVEMQPEADRRGGAGRNRPSGKAEVQ